MRCRGSTSRRLVDSTSRSLPIDSASSASVIVRSRAAAISRASGSPSTRPTSSATRCRSNVPSSAPGAAAAARSRNSSTAGESGPAVGSGASARTCSPSRASGSRLVASTRSRSPLRRSWGTISASGVEDVLAVVEHEHGVDGPGRLQQRPLRAGPQVERARRSSTRRRPRPPPGRARRRARRARTRSATLAGDVGGQARLADAAGPDERDEAGGAHRGDDVALVVLPPDRRRERRGRDGDDGHGGCVRRRLGGRLQRLALGAAQIEPGHEPGIAERGRGTPCRAQRLGRTPGPGERPHEDRPRRLAHVVGGDDGLAGGGGLREPARPRGRRAADELDGIEARQLEPAGLGAHAGVSASSPYARPRHAARAATSVGDVAVLAGTGAGRGRTSMHRPSRRAAARASSRRPTLRRRSPTTRRRREICERSVFTALAGGESSHTASASTSIGTTWPSRASSVASTIRCVGLPMSATTSSPTTRSGPSTPKSTGRHVTERGGAIRASTGRQPASGG